MPLSELSAPSSTWSLPPRSAVLAAHPDDEVIGAGGLLLRSRDVDVLHLTDGAPHDRGLWGAAPTGTSREAYARIRRSEAEAALAHARVPAARLHALGAADQRAWQRLVPLVHVLERWLSAHRPKVLLTHAYEGGHPDHDAAAFVAHAAVARLDGVRPELWEMTSYHRRDGRLLTGAFLPSERREHICPLSPDALERKRAMFRAFESQQAVLAAFELGPERFRPAPRYDFTASPSPEPLHYETLGWPLTGDAWRAAAQAAMRSLGWEKGPWL